jgi:outer membrane protein assembly factor BamB
MRFARLLAPLFLASIVAAGAVASSPGVASASGSGSWTQFHYAATRSGYDPLEKTLNPGNVGRISVRLQATFSGSVYDTPLVSGGRIFVSDASGKLTALRQSDGRKLWSATVGFIPDSTPAIWNGQIVAPGVDAKGSFVAAFDVVTGSLRWRTRLSVDQYASITAPAIFGSTVYVSAGTSIYALSASSGRVLWKTRLTTSSDGIVAGPVAVSGYGEYVVAAGLDGHVYALDAATGSVHWNVLAGGGIDHAGPSIYSGIVYVPEGASGAEGGGVYLCALQVSDGRLLWRSDIGDDVHVTPAAGQGRVFIGSIDDGVEALDSKTGALLWAAPYQGEVWGAPMLANGVVYFGTDEQLVAYDAATGNLLYLSQISTSIASMASPAVVDGRVYMGSGDDEMLVLGLR